jgi:hypothetical protein
MTPSVPQINRQDAETPRRRGLLDAYRKLGPSACSPRFGRGQSTLSIVAGRRARSRPWAVTGPKKSSGSWRARRLGGSILLPLAILVLAACGERVEDSSAETPVSPPADAIKKLTERGPVKVTVTVWPPKPTLTDPIYARLEIESPPGVQVDAPPQQIGEGLGRFRIVEIPKSTGRTASGGLFERQTYVLEAPSSGRHRIPPLRLEMVDGRPDQPEANRKPQEILTDEIPLEIGAVPAEQATATLRPAMGELDPDVGKTSWLMILGLVSAVMVLASGSVLAIRAARGRRTLKAQRSAYDEAVAELRGLEARGAPSPEVADAWFVQLSAIIRRYLERRYLIRAPELTTEEFLQVATSRPELRAEHRKLLTLFLERCDRVKFAGYRPDADESIASLASARGFVEDTRLRIHGGEAVTR